MIALIDWPEAIVITALLVVVGSLAMYLLRGRKQWRHVRIGFFLERNGHLPDEEE